MPANPTKALNWATTLTVGTKVNGWSGAYTQGPGAIVGMRELTTPTHYCFEKKTGVGSGSSVWIRCLETQLSEHDPTNRHKHEWMGTLAGCRRTSHVRLWIGRSPWRLNVHHGSRKQPIKYRAVTCWSRGIHSLFATAAYQDKIMSAHTTIFALFAILVALMRAYGIPFRMNGALHISHKWVVGISAALLFWLAFWRGVVPVIWEYGNLILNF